MRSQRINKLLLLLIIHLELSNVENARTESVRKFGVGFIGLSQSLGLDSLLLVVVPRSSSADVLCF